MHEPTISKEYLQAVFADEVEMAHLLNYRPAGLPTHAHPHALLYPQGAPGVTARFPLPRWRREWVHAAPLLDHHGLSLEQNTAAGYVIVTSRDRLHSTIERFDAHPDQGAAIRAAIVRTLIRYLKAQRATAAAPCPAEAATMEPS